MTLGEIVALANVGIGNLAIGCAGLNGFQKAVGDKVILQPFSLTDEVRQWINRNKFALKDFLEIDSDERKRITAEVMGEPGKPNFEALLVPPDDDARQAQWGAAYDKACKVKHDVPGLHVFERSDLFRDNKNPIPPDTEAALGPIIAGSPWREKFIQPTAGTPPGGE